jgi:hypothetical protein
LAILEPADDVQRNPVIGIIYMARAPKGPFSDPSI